MQSQNNNQNDLIVYRRRMGFSQRDVAKLLGHADASMISHYEHGRASPPLSVALSLEIIYRAPVAFLFPNLYERLRRRIRAEEEDLNHRGSSPHH